MLVVYVDDFKLQVPVKNFIKEGWDLISSVIDMDLREVMGRYFGCMHKEEHNLKLPKTLIVFVMRSGLISNPSDTTITPASNV